jgi:hypothetical protein
MSRGVGLNVCFGKISSFFGKEIGEFWGFFFWGFPNVNSSNLAIF